MFVFLGGGEGDRKISARFIDITFLAKYSLGNGLQFVLIPILDPYKTSASVLNYNIKYQTLDIKFLVI